LNTCAVLLSYRVTLSSDEHRPSWQLTTHILTASIRISSKLYYLGVLLTACCSGVLISHVRFKNSWLQTEGVRGSLLFTAAFRFCLHARFKCLLVLHLVCCAATAVPLSNSQTTCRPVVVSLQLLVCQFGFQHLAHHSEPTAACYRVGQ
jgi:hypothetical protein